MQATPMRDEPERRALLTTPLGGVAVRWRDAVVTGVELDPAPGDGATDRAGVPAWLLRQIDAYCAHPGFRFSLPTAPAGTPFQREVWRLIAAIPAGTTRTYAEIAAELGSAPRAVGGACRANPYPLLVPCHRVVSKAGLGGFAGDTSGRLVAFKRRLLAHEGVLAGIHAVAPDRSETGAEEDTGEGVGSAA